MKNDRIRLSSLIPSFRALFVCVFIAVYTAGLADAATLIWPENRTAYYADESVEIAVAGLATGETATVQFAPKSTGLKPVTFPFTGDGSTVTVSVPGYTFAPDTYSVTLDGSAPTPIVISSGVRNSTFLISQTQGGPGATFTVGNSYGYGLIGPDGLPMKDIRGKRSQTMQFFDNQVAANMPTLVYGYWTGYVTHKPFGVNKSYVDPAEVEEMRLLNFATAEHLRRYNENIISVCTIDEPGLQWGRTAIGTSQSGFPDWDEKDYYESHGAKFTNDPGSLSDADYLKYVSVRCGILKGSWQTAKQDLKTVWPQMVFSTDCYAPSAIMDGTDPMNQLVNDIPATHVFMDWGRGRLATIGTLDLEKSATPYSKAAHAMNGQLFGTTCGQPNQRDAYRLTLNAMLASGLVSNWWLNTGGMSADDLLGIDEPAQRMGPMFDEFSTTDHDVAILFSHSELALREKPILAAQAKGQNVNITVTGLPANSAIQSAKVGLGEYNVGSNYDDTLLLAHQALNRAGYAAQILHEDVLGKYLKDYKVLLIVGQTHALPDEVLSTIKAFEKAGGTVMIDKTSTIAVPGAFVIGLNAQNTGYKWGAMFEQPPKTFKTAKEASYFQTNFYMDSPARTIAPFLKGVMRATKARPVIDTASTFLGCERQVAGDGALYMVLNGFEQLPQIADTALYPIYNYAPHEATFTLKGISPTSVGYAIEGPDWKTVSRVDNPRQPQDANFAAGEMKLYLVAPHDPDRIAVTAAADSGKLSITAQLVGLKMPWPIEVTVADPSGAKIFHLYRSMKADGTYSETIPFGGNGRAGEYTVTVTSPAGSLGGTATADFAGSAPTAQPITDAVRIFDEPAIKAFLATKPELTIVTSSADQTAIAQKLADGLNAAGCKATVADEKDVIVKATYPRVWDPIVLVTEKRPQDIVKVAKDDEKVLVTLESSDDMLTIATTPQGVDLGDNWAKPYTLATVGPRGWIDYSTEEFFKEGCKLFIDSKGNRVYVNTQHDSTNSTEAFRQQWSRPWTKLSSFIGTDKMPPQLPEAYTIRRNLIVLYDGGVGTLSAALRASEIMPQSGDVNYPGPGKALVEYAWSPFMPGANVILMTSGDITGLESATKTIADVAAK